MGLIVLMETRFVVSLSYRTRIDQIRI